MKIQGDTYVTDKGGYAAWEGAEYIINFLTKDHRFNYLGRGANLGFWATYEKGDKSEYNSIPLVKFLAGKGYMSFRIIIFNEGREGVELLIEGKLGGCDYETFFEGFIETNNDWDRLMVSLGINASTYARKFPILEKYHDNKRVNK